MYFTRGRQPLSGRLTATSSTPEIATATQANMARQRDPKGLMATAGISAGGQPASGMTYAPEYNELRSKMVQLRKAADDKNAPRGGVPAPTR